MGLRYGLCMHACKPLLENIAKRSNDMTNASRAHVHMFTSTYAFILRLPSEALPPVARFGGMAVESNSMIYVRRGDDVLVLKGRKNRLRGKTLVRGCWRAASRLTCPVHVLGDEAQAWGTHLQ